MHRSGEGGRRERRRFGTSAVKSNQEKGGAIDYRIDREALAEFIARQVDLVEAVSVPQLLAEVVEPRMRHEAFSRDEVRALWLGAGLATHVGLAIFEEPERFVTSSDPTRRPPAAVAA